MTLVGDWHILFPKWQGYGSFVPAARDLFRKWKGRVDRVVMRTERTDEGIDYDVCIESPEHGGYERDDSLHAVWVCSVVFRKGEEHPTYRAIESAHDQQTIADGCVELLFPKDGQ